MRKMPGEGIFSSWEVNVVVYPVFLGRFFNSSIRHPDVFSQVYFSPIEVH